MMVEGGMHPGQWRDVEKLDRNIVRGVEQERRNILGLAVAGEWPSVLKILCQDSSSSIAQQLPMNSSKDTVVHLAASDGQTEVVHNLLKLLVEEEPKREGLANNSGNTPLHLAASMGHADTCKCIADMVPELAQSRNADGETPIFVAALNGYKNVFITLTSMFPPTPEIALARRNDGDTILHCAISGEYFDLASAIIDKYEQLIYYRNERGLTPLHLLANNPSAFRSGCRLQFFDHFFYSSIKVSTESKSDDIKHQKQEECTSKLPGNYLMCWSFFNLLRNIFATIGQSRYLRGTSSRDQQTSEHPVSVTKFFRVFYKFLLAAWLFILAIIGFSRHITRMKKKKHKHRGAKEVMEKLLHNIDHWWEFGEINTGMNPSKHHLEWMTGINPGATLLVEEIHFASLQGEEIALEADTNSMQESQSTHTTGLQQQQGPLTHSHMHSSTIAKSPNQQKEDNKIGIIESPFLIAGKKGVIEMVEEILKKFPLAIHDMDIDHKNIMLLAAEHRQPEIYMFVLRRKSENWLGKVDAEGNSVLHLAAKHPQKQPLLIPGAALQMQREIKWFKFVKKNMPPHFSKRLNHKGQTAMEVFTDTHQELAMQRAKWLGNASQSCSVVATLITTVAFATISSVPGGLLQDHGSPVLQGRLAFSLFSASSLIALCFSAISLIMFLGILTSPYQDLDFGNDLPKKLICGLASLFISIASMFLSFFSGDLFVLGNKMSYMAYPIFILTSCVALAGFPLYFEFISQTVTPIPKRTYPHKHSF